MNRVAFAILVLSILLVISSNISSNTTTLLLNFKEDIAEWNLTEQFADLNMVYTGTVNLQNQPNLLPIYMDGEYVQLMGNIVEDGVIDGELVYTDLFIASIRYTEITAETLVSKNLYVGTSVNLAGYDILNLDINRGSLLKPYTLKQGGIEVWGAE